MNINVHSKCCWTVVVLLAWRCAPALALVVVPPGTNDNTSPPDMSIPWNNVGNNGIYLGNRWVVTAYHIGPATVTFSTGTFFHETGSEVRLQKNGNEADLLLYRVTADPGLPSLTIGSSTPDIDAEVTLIGDGRTVMPGDQVIYWNVTENPGTPPPTYFWTPVAESDPHNASGYHSDVQRKLWGTNLVEDDELVDGPEMDDDHTVLVDDGSGLTYSFLTEFDKEGETDGLVTVHEAQAQENDSGSGVFIKEGGNWVLAGVTYGIGAFEDQPSAASNAVFGNVTFIGDLSQYRDQILAVTAIVPEPGGFLLVGGIGAMIGLVRLVTRPLR
jgi:hypothetical protein